MFEHNHTHRSVVACLRTWNSLTPVRLSSGVREDTWIQRNPALDHRSWRHILVTSLHVRFRHRYPEPLTYLL